MNNKVVDPRLISREQGYEIVCAGVNQVKGAKKMLVVFLSIFTSLDSISSTKF
jgi:hypothetical protein